MCIKGHCQYWADNRLHLIRNAIPNFISIIFIPPGHNVWVVGNEPVVAVDFTGLADYQEAIVIVGTDIYYFFEFFIQH
jgi:hypothetical protein